MTGNTIFSVLLHFLLRDAMRKRGLCCRPVSVRLSVTLVTAEYIVKLLTGPSSPIILVFLTPAPVPNSMATRSAGRKVHVGENNLRFSTEIAIYLGNSTR